MCAALATLYARAWQRYRGEGRWSVAGELVLASPVMASPVPAIAMEQVPVPVPVPHMRGASRRRRWRR